VPARRVSPASEADVQRTVSSAARAGEGVRVVATGHSFSPVHLTDGTLVELANLQGVLAIDAARRRARGTVAREDAYLSPQYETPTLVLSVSGRPGTDHWGYLRRVDRLLGDEFRARVHWGELHLLTPEQLHDRYPAAQRFIDIRHELDPAGRS
jgi:FAD/FMN-containing dehydrogenase